MYSTITRIVRENVKDSRRYIYIPFQLSVPDNNLVRNMEESICLADKLPFIFYT